ncbi:hypothetical protein [uncultured Chitinophaga sp.]|jgi:hypothetical protein|uniref:hypothetical protein n=1 Tax=uncultured Chitinophaga sp. TaxID=339340 RepID=UPI002635BAF1|nr:hypothetical protein [uncultured Chitinophaga sp.]
MKNLHHPHKNTDTASWGQVILSVAVAFIGFGFAIFRYLQFSGLAANLRLSRIERPIYRLAGKWGIITVFILMGLTGVYYTIRYYRLMRK